MATTTTPFESPQRRTRHRLAVAHRAFCLGIRERHRFAARRATAAAQQAAIETAQGLRFWGSGVYVVGKDVQPGTFQAAGNITNCYWARLDAAGNIIDNNFVSAATQVQVTVQPTDFSLEIDGACGEFVNIG